MKLRKVMNIGIGLNLFWMAFVIKNMVTGELKEHMSMTLVTTTILVGFNLIMMNLKEVE